MSDQLFTFRIRHSGGEIEMYSGHGRLCDCLCVCPSPHSHTTAYRADPDVSWDMIGVPSSCALLGGFAIGARVSLL